MILQEQQKYFVRIDNPADVRRTILENSKSVIVLLQRFERFKERRIEKEKEMQKLKTVILELQDLTSRLRKSLPQPSASFKSKKVKVEKLKAEPKPLPAVQPKHIEAAVEHVAERSRPRIPSELEKLDSELQDIETKLARLS